MRNSGFIWIIIAFMALLDIYVFQVVRMLSQHSSPKLRLAIYIAYWTLSIGAIVLLMVLPYINYDNWPKAFRSYLFATIVGLFFAKLIASLFFLADDVRRGVTWLITKLFSSQSFSVSPPSDGISRSVFLSWVGLAVGGGLFGTLMYGFGNKYRYQLKRIQLAYDNIPKAFKGLKIVHISDIHSGSFADKKAVVRGVEKILKEKPDLLLFTGDLVNDRAIEMDDYMDVFSKLKAPMGVYSILGNHDYGDYYYGHSPVGEKAIEKEDNLKRVKELHGELGWKLLLDEHILLEKEGEQIPLIGVQNISGKSSFHSYGDMNRAYAGTEKYPFKILLSHDPSHWDAEVRTKYPDIDLMLAGHTHGMQFGVELPGFKWSPVQYMYKKWAGLYEEGKQKLYVNRGFGFIGYPGRVGILPEITIIELV